MPASCNRRIASADSGRTASATAKAPLARLRSRPDRSRFGPCEAASSANCRISSRRFDAETLEQTRAAVCQCAAFDRRLDAVTRNGLKTRSPAEWSSLRSVALATIARATGCSASCSTAAANRERVVLATAVDRAHCDDAMLAERQRARLVEYHGGDESRLLEPTTVAHEQIRCARPVSSTGQRRAAQPGRAHAGQAMTSTVTTRSTVYSPGARQRPPTRLP